MNFSPSMSLPEGEPHAPGPDLNPWQRASSVGARLDRLPASRTVWRLVLLLSAGMFFEVYELLLSGYVAPGLVRSGLLSAGTQGLFGMDGVAGFIAALFAGLFVGTCLCGYLADRLGRRFMFTFSLLWYSAANVGVVMQSSPEGLYAWRFVAGLGIGVELITIGTYLTELAPPALRGRAFAILQAIGFTAVPIVAGLSYLLVPSSPFGVAGWKYVVLGGSLGAVAIGWVRRGLPESPRWLARCGRLDEAERIVCGLEARVQHETGQPLPPPPPPHEPPRARLSTRSFMDMWRPPYGKRAVMLVIFHVFQTVGYFGFANWVPSLLMARGMDTTSSLLYTTFIGLAAPLGPLLGYAFADRFERKTVIVVMSGVNVVSGLLFSQAGTPALVILLGVCLTLAGNIISFTYHAYQQELFPTEIRARAVGFVYSWSRLSAILSAFVIAFVLRNLGVVGVFGFIAAAMLIVMVTVGLLGPRSRGLSLEALSH